MEWYSQAAEPEEPLRGREPPEAEQESYEHRPALERKPILPIASQSAASVSSLEQSGHHLEPSELSAHRESPHMRPLKRSRFFSASQQQALARQDDRANAPDIIADGGG